MFECVTKVYLNLNKIAFFVCLKLIDHDGLPLDVEANLQYVSNELAHFQVKNIQE